MGITQFSLHLHPSPKMMCSSLSLLAAFCLVSLSLPVADAETQLRSSENLVSKCYNFPSNNFDTSNNVKASYGKSPHLVLETGDAATDFTLHDLDGEAWNLADTLLKGGGKPVVLIWGMSTCPAYQGLDSQGSDYRWTYWDENNLVTSRTDKAIFVHMYGPEPHPTVPDTNFDSGRLLPNYWSLTRQQFTYEERVAAAMAIRPYTHPDEVILVDYLPGNPYSELIQPVWCSYAMGARPSVMISSSGTIFYQQSWLNTDDLAEAIDAYYRQNGEGVWDGDNDLGPLGEEKTAKLLPKAAARAKREEAEGVVGGRLEKKARAP